MQGLVRQAAHVQTLLHGMAASVLCFAISFAARHPPTFLGGYVDASERDPFVATETCRLCVSSMQAIGVRKMGHRVKLGRRAQVGRLPTFMHTNQTACLEANLRTSSRFRLLYLESNTA
jgi:hypothetical protein